MGKRTQGIAALASGGLDSCVMLAELAKSAEPVYPIYIRCGLFWEKTELRFLRDFVSTVSDSRILEPQLLKFPMDDVYSGQWQTTGTEIPGYYEADERWEIPGRNLILISKTAVWCRHTRSHVLRKGMSGLCCCPLSPRTSRRGTDRAGDPGQQSIQRRDSRVFRFSGTGAGQGFGSCPGNHLSFRRIDQA